MPELPEVEAARSLVETHCGGQKITTAITTEGGGGPRDGAFDDIVFDDSGAHAQSIAKALEGKRLLEVRRRGKQLWLLLDSPPHAMCHFGMTGAFVVRGVAALKYKEFAVRDEEWPPRFTKMELGFEAGTALAFCDPRRLGRIRLRADPIHEDPWKSLAPDPLVDTIELERWLRILGGKKCVVKALLLDQNTLVSGVGNWVADEVLFQAGIHPDSVCSSLSTAQAERLHASLLHVVSVAVSAGANAESFPVEWLFHYRWGKGAGGTKVPGAQGGPITFLTSGGRTSAVVLSRQRKGEKTSAEAAAASTAGSSGKSEGGTAAKGKAKQAGGKSKRKAAAADAAEPEEAHGTHEAHREDEAVAASASAPKRARGARARKQ